LINDDDPPMYSKLRKWGYEILSLADFVLPTLKSAKPRPRVAVSPGLQEVKQCNSFRRRVVQGFSVWLRSRVMS